MKRISLRDLFWLVLVVAMGLGWWSDHRRLEKIANRQDERYAMEVAECEVKKREKWRAGSSSRIYSVDIKPTGREFLVVVLREPPTPGGERYITVNNGRVVDYGKGK